MIGNWVFGCEICQVVCPWNEKFAGQKYDPAFTPRFGIPPSNLIDELSLTPEQFNQKFKGSPIKRVKRRGFLRNAAVVLGNLGDQKAVPALCIALHDPEPVIRGHAAWALGQIGGEVARRTLTGSFQGEPHPEVRVEIKRALTQT
jgi:epoxyqueuosine reductase